MAGPHFRYEVATAESTPACHDARKLRASLAAVLALVYVPACDGPSVASAGPPYHVQNDVTDLQPGVCTRPAAGWHAIWPRLKHYN